jgi:hypothetical protein
MYIAAREAFDKFAQASGESITDKETSNVYAEMCRAKIGGFKRGFDHIMNSDSAIFHGRLESHEYGQYYSFSTYGHLEITVEGTSELVKKVQEAWTKGKKTNWNALNPVIGQYFKDKQHCYGFCKNDD